MTQETQKALDIQGSRNLPAWLAQNNISLAFSTYQTGKLFLIGSEDKQTLSVFERTFERCMGLYTEKDSLYMSTAYQLWHLENIAKEAVYEEYDAVFTPMHGLTTGDIDIHDIAKDEDGNFLFVSTLFNCVATTSATHHFKPVWKPKFISALVSEDRCHLNGLAIRNGQPRYVTALSQSDVHDGWREHRKDGGVVIDIQTDELVCDGLSMPHSPRFYHDRLWLHNSGKGEFGYIDFDKKTFVPLCFCPGYLRGLNFIDNYAVAAMSKPREKEVFDGLPLEEKLKEKSASARTGLVVIDLKNGAIVHQLSIEGIVREIYDVVILEGVKKPMAIGFQNDEIRHFIAIEESNIQEVKN